jgi:hypothetical protein
VARKAFYIYRESLEGGKSTAEHAAQALRLAAQERVALWVGGAAGETQQRMDWQQAGVPVGAPPVADVSSQILKTFGLFKTRRLFVFDSCRGLIDELGTCSWALSSSGATTDKVKDEASFHRLAALRYLTSVFDLPGAEGVIAGEPDYHADRVELLRRRHGNHRRA